MSSQTVIMIDLLFQINKAMHEQLRDAGEAYPISLPDVIALSYIERVGAASITDMATHFGVRKSSMSTKIAKLERQGLLTRDSCLFDKRSHSIRLTDKARDTLEETKLYIATHTDVLFSKLTPEEQQRCITYLQKIIS